MRFASLITALALFVPAAALAQMDLADAPRVPAPRERMGLTVAADIGGGFAYMGSNTIYSPAGLLELELLVGYDLFRESLPGFRAELGLLLGFSPNVYYGFRPGVRYSLPAMPFYARAALDLSAPRAYLQARWVLVGGGYELQLTDQLGAFAEADVGIPFSGTGGVPFLIRAGAAFRF